MADKKRNAIDPAKFALYEKLIGTDPKIELKGAANPYTSHNGYMFTFQNHQSGEVGIRLPEKERDAFLKKYKTKLIESYGVIMKEFVAVPDALLKKTNELKPYLKMSLEYTAQG